MNRILEKYETDEYFFSFLSPELINAEKIQSLLQKVDTDFNPRLSIIHDLSKYAEKIINQADAIYAITKSDFKVCGISVFYLRNRISDYGYWTMLAILNEYRGKGLGRKLSEAMISCCKMEPTKGILSKAWSTNIPSVQLHASLGFEIDGMEKRNNSDDYTVKFKLLF